MCAHLTQRKAKPTGMAYVDSTTHKVYRNLRIPRHKVFVDIAMRGKGYRGWLYGFKLHLLMIEHQFLKWLMGFWVRCTATKDIYQNR
ncbi:MAG: hypothetical protein CENE_02691 [Candidatus Celerinatantimonas neptuna]|nr:MAG: hypothetical protein CENE_02691 [Candidatus Celerinatantimonas neptuna]